MQTKKQISLTRKALYGIMLLGIFFSAFGAGNLPSARAQKVDTDTPTFEVTETPTDVPSQEPTPTLGEKPSADVSSPEPTLTLNETPIADVVALSAISVLSGDNNYFLKVDLQDPGVSVRTGLANNDSGGLQTLSGMATRYQGKGYLEWAVLNGDLFSPSCGSGVNCAQGLTYIDGNQKPNWSAYGTTWQVRGNIGFDSSKGVQIAVGDAQSRRHMTIAGGPWIVTNGGTPTCSAQYINGKTYFSTGEQFDGDDRSWCTDTRAITMVGYSSDHRYLYLGVSAGGKTVIQLAQWLKDRGAYEVLRLDSGGSSGIYHNGSLAAGANTRPIADHLAIIFQEAPSTPPPSSGNWQAKYAEGDSCWWDTNCGQFNGTAVPKCDGTITGPELHKDWGSSAPCGGMSGDNWVGNFAGTIYFPSGNYVFHLDHDDGAKFWLNGQNKGDFGGSGNNTICNGTGGFSLSGDQSLRAIIREQGGDAKIHLTWDTNTSVCTPPAPSANFDAWPLSGTAPFTSALHIVNTSNITSCSWNYGDGQTGTSCASSHNHTYNTAGTFTVSLTVSGPGGSDSMTRTNYITVSAIPSAPSNFTVTGTTNNNIALTWQDNSNNETGFNIYRWDYIGSVWEFYLYAQTGANVNSYTNTQLSCGKDYYYQVSAYSAQGESDRAGWVLGTTLDCPIPAAPSNLVASGSSQPSLTWTSNHTGDYHFHVERSLDASNWEEISYAINPAFTDTEVDCNTLYYYRVRTHDYTFDTFSNYSNVASTITTSCIIPSNDDFNSATLIGTIPYNTSLDTRGATIAGDDPQLTTCNRLAGQASVWYQYTPSVTRKLQIDTKGSDYDTLLAVWRGVRGSLIPIGCNDDVGTVNGEWDPDSILTLSLNAGTTYYIEASTFNGYIDVNGLEALDQTVKPIPDTTALSGGLLNLHISKSYQIFLPLLFR